MTLTKAQKERRRQLKAKERRELVKVERKIRKKGNAFSYANPGPVGTVGRIMGEAAGSIGGSALGGAFGGPPMALVGSRVGRYMGGAAGGLAHYIGKIFGSGTYEEAGMPLSGETESNSLTPAHYSDVQTLKEGSPAPTFASADSAVEIVMEETIGIVRSSKDFQNQYTINLSPSDPYSFPWLAPVAQRFTAYELVGCLITFESTSSNFNGTDQELGSVMICTTYDPAAPAPATTREFMNRQHSQLAKPSVSQIHPVECAPDKVLGVKRHFVAPLTGVPEGKDSRFYEKGVVHIATAGNSEDLKDLGVLKVTYHYKFYEPQTPPPYSPLGSLELISRNSRFGTDPNRVLLNTGGIYRPNVVQNHGMTTANGSDILDFWSLYNTGVPGNQMCVPLPRFQGERRRFLFTIGLQDSGANTWSPADATIIADGGNVVEIPIPAGAYATNGKMDPYWSLIGSESSFENTGTWHYYSCLLETTFSEDPTDGQFHFSFLTNTGYFGDDTSNSTVVLITELEPVDRPDLVVETVASIDLMIEAAIKRHEDKRNNGEVYVKVPKL